MKIPIFIIVHNQYEILKKSVESYEKFIKTPIEIIFHNVSSVYFETLNYLKEKENEGYKVYNSNVNNHHTVLDSVNDYLKKNKSCEYVIITDPDIELFNVNDDILDIYIYALKKLNKTTVGPMLEINDIPNSYYNKELAILGHKNQFWSKPRKNIEYNGKKIEYIDCMTDTTFQLFSTKNIPQSFPHSNSIRFFSPYSAKHLDWYINADNIYPCELFCSLNATNISHWNNSKWTGKYYNKKVKSIFDSFKIKYNYIYYFNKCKCKNNYNFGDFITPFIFEKLTGKKSKLDINGGEEKENVIIGAGSILSHCKSNSIIWGTGFMFGNEKKINPKKILSVRGPLTRERLKNIGVNCPEVYGDIGLILPYFYYPEVKKEFKLGIIPHYIDMEKFKSFFPITDNNIKLIDVTEPIDTVIKNILKCEVTMSSSLHGIIVSHAYNIKCMWLKISNKIGGGYFKYRDYYGSIKLNNYKNILPFELNKKINTDELINMINKYYNPIFPLNTKHILEICPFINIKKILY